MPTRPRLDSWLEALAGELEAIGEPPVVICHSLGCILWLHHLAGGGSPAERVLLVAPPSRAGVPEVLASFFPVPEIEGGRIVCSDNDQYCPEGAADAVRRADRPAGRPGAHQPRRGLRRLAGGRGVGARRHRAAHGAIASTSSRIAPG